MVGDPRSTSLRSPESRSPPDRWSETRARPRCARPSHGLLQIDGRRPALDLAALARVTVSSKLMVGDPRSTSLRSPESRSPPSPPVARQHLVSGARPPLAGAIPERLLAGPERLQRVDHVP